MAPQAKIRELSLRKQTKYKAFEGAAGENFQNLASETNETQRISGAAGEYFADRCARGPGGILFPEHGKILITHSAFL